MPGENECALMMSRDGGKHNYLQEQQFVTALQFPGCDRQHTHLYLFFQKCATPPHILVHVHHYNNSDCM